jgi:hypothetical protein
MENKIEEPKKYKLAQKLGNIPGLMEKFLVSPAFKTVLDYIRNMQISSKGLKRSQIKPSENVCILGFNELFDKIEEIFNNNPPKKGQERYDDPVFARFHEELTNKYDDLIKLILKPNYDADLALEIRTYFLDSFGNQHRLDYGTGHEMNFMLTLLILYKAGYYSEEDFAYVSIEIFYKYTLFARKLQLDYMLEPAGTRGVWGLDEYQFLPFVFGAAQLYGNKEISPSILRDNYGLCDYEDEYLFISCVKHIKDVKKGASFSEYAPILYSISKVRKWEKVGEGLLKMYEDDVLKKVVVIQHFYFGSILTLE